VVALLFTDRMHRVPRIEYPEWLWQRQPSHSGYMILQLPVSGLTGQSHQQLSSGRMRDL
jgi:hypothetical protein